MSGGEVSTHPMEEEREGTPGGEDPEKSNNKGGSEEGLRCQVPYSLLECLLL